MNIEHLQNYCIDKPAVNHEIIGHSSYYKIKDKIFVIFDHHHEHEKITFKSSLEDCQVLRAEHDFIKPGYHINKEHWNTIYLTGQTNPEMLKAWIDASYQIALSSLSNKQKSILGLIPTSQNS